MNESVLLDISNSLTLIPIVGSKTASIVDCQPGEIYYSHKITLSSFTCNIFNSPSSTVILSNGESLDKQVAQVVLHRGPTPGNYYIKHWLGNERKVNLLIEACLPQEVFDDYLSRKRFPEHSAIVIEYIIKVPLSRRNDSLKYWRDSGEWIHNWDNSEELLDIKSIQFRYAQQFSDEEVNDLYCRTLDLSYGPNVPYYSQKWRLWEDIKTLTAHYAFDNGWDTATFKEKLEESYQWIERLQCALNPMCHLDQFGKRSLLDETSWASKWLKEGTDLSAERQLEVIWRWRSPKRVLVDGEESGHYWPIGIDNITDIAQYYLQYPWMQCRTADFYLLCGFLYSEYLGFVVSEKPKLPSVYTLFRAAHSDKAPVTNKTWLSLLLEFSKWMFRVSALGAFTFALADQFGWPVALFSGILIYKIHAIAAAIEMRHEQDRTLKRCALFDQMERDYQLLWDTSDLSPTYLKECFLESTRAGVLWPKPVFAILERAIARDPSVWK